MKFVTIKQNTNLQALSAALLKPSAAAGAAVEPAATLERIRALNPHVDVQELAPGDVLLVPDAPDIDPQQTQSVGGNAFDGFAEEIRRGLATLAKRLRAQSDTLAGDRASVTSALKLASIKRLVDSDPQLKKQVADVDAQAKADQSAAQAAAKQVEALQKQVDAELDALGKLLR